MKNKKPLFHIISVPFNYLTLPWIYGPYICTVEVWTDTCDPLFSRVHEGLIIFKLCSAKKFLQFTAEVIISSCQIRIIRWCLCCPKFSDISSGFVPDMWRGALSCNSKTSWFCRCGRSRHSRTWGFFRVAAYTLVSQNKLLMHCTLSGACAVFDLSLRGTLYCSLLRKTVAGGICP